MNYIVESSMFCFATLLSYTDYRKIVCFRVVSNTADAESEASKALVFSKEKELALALMKVTELTRQLEQLRGCGGCSTRRSMIDSPTMSAAAAAAVVHKPIVKPTVAPPPPPVNTVTTASLSDVSSFLITHKYIFY